MSGTEDSAIVLVTGASGFIASHCIVQLLERSYQVRGTLRNMSRESALRQVLARHTAGGERLTFVPADLLQDDGWQAAMAGCDYLLHIASPVPMAQPKHDDELIVPAREGTLRVLRAAAAAGVKRAVLTSSLAAVAGGHSDFSRTLDESDWSDLQGEMTLYAKSKTLAEKAAWEYVHGLEGERPMELAVVNPGVVLGPLLDGQNVASSVDVIRKLLLAKLPGNPRYKMTIVDVRDVAGAHLLAMTQPAAAGKRFCCLVDIMWVNDVAKVLARHFGDQGYKVPTWQAPDWLVRIVGLWDEHARYVVSRLGRDFTVSHERLVKELGWQPRSAEEAIVATGESMIGLGVVRSP